MSAIYTSDKPDGTLAIRNSVYREREARQQMRELAAQDALRNLPDQSQENYGKKDI